MKSLSLPRCGRHPRKSRSGVALLVVLACLVLLAVMILAFLGSISTELQTSKVYANGSSVRLLAESTVNLVVAEIRDATSNASQCWASQPGMIRTYDNTGTPVNYYKLYSDSGMVGSGLFDHTAASNGVPSNWYSQKGVYVDINQPATVTSGGSTVLLYPILDGNNGANDLVTASTGAVDATAGIPTGASVLGPLYSDTTSGTTRTMPQTAGFWLNSPTAATNPTPVDPTSPNHAPMPVKWLYVLQQGQVIAPDAWMAGQPVTFQTSSTIPTASNPIVGRMAFWTDDETCKININTASEGAYNSVTTSGSTTTIKSSFTDTPRVSTPFDLNMAKASPWQNEFQRYPGHPATVSLSKVFGSLTTDPGYPENIYSSFNANPNTVTGLAPRTIAGGSKEASVATAGASAAALNLLGNRLYATPDEFLLKPYLSGSPSTRVLNSSTLASSSELDQNSLQRAKFFITASSRAPDLNLFNLPRVGIWPVSSNIASGSSYCTAFDRLIAFCTTVGNQIYYFQRTPNPTSQADTGYLGQTEWNDVTRNKTLLSYLSTLGNTPIPGFGGTFSAKYSTTTGTGTNFSGTGAASEFDQILMEIFDYVRIVNMYDTSLASGGSNLNQYCANSNTNTGGGEVVPSYDASRDIKGFGRFETISKAGLLFIGIGNSATPQVLSVSGTTAVNGPPVPAGKVRVQVAPVFSLFDPAQGFTGLYPTCTLKITACNLTWDYGNLFPNIVGAKINAYPYFTQGWSGNLGFNPLRKGLLFASPSASSVLSSIPASTADTNNLTDFSTTGKINFGGGDMTVQILKGSTVVQTITFTFPAGIFPVPAVTSPVGTSTTKVACANFNNPGGTSPVYYGRLDPDNILTAGGNFYSYWVTSNDTLNTLQSVNGDIRLIAGRNTISATTSPKNTDLFDKNPLWGAQWAHTFFENSLPLPLWGATRGQYVKGLSYWEQNTYGLAPGTPLGYSNNMVNCLDHSSALSTCEPEGFGSVKYPPASTGGVTAGDNKNTGWSSGNPPGDWDNGVGSTQDGPYINKPDEGLFTDNATYPAYFTASKYDSTKRVGTAYFSPARQISSAVMLGSLPTGVIDNRPWQTLLFHPDPTGKHVGNKDMKGNGSATSGMPADHLLLDLFTMPVVEPYAISEPLSTAGRINMNYLIVPFTYINRDTGIRAVLASQQMTVIPNSYSLRYKQDVNLYTPTFTGATYPYLSLRVGINPVETLKEFQARFFPSTYGSSSSPDIFRSPSEICTIDLAPNANTSGTTTDAGLTFGNGPTVSSMKSSAQTYWESHLLTGDNSRERPYANIYPLLTTKSNTFTIHYRVQSLKQALAAGTTGTAWAQWREDSDVVTGEYRGSQTVERYIDPGDTTIKDYATNPTATPTLASLYKFRVLSTRQFAP